MRGFSQRTVIFFVFSLLFAFSLFYRSNMTMIVEDLLEAFAVSPASLGILASAFFYAYGAVQVPVGMLCDKVGVRFTVFTLGMAGVAGSLLFAFSGGLKTALLGRVLLGAGTAGVWVPALKYLSLYYKEDEFATLASVINIFGALGILLASLPFAVMVEKTGWRATYFLSGVLFCSLVLGAWFLMSPAPIFAQKGPLAPAATAVGERNKEGKEKGNRGSLEKSSGWEGLSPALRGFFRMRPSFWIFVFWAFLIYGVFFTFTGLWGGAYLQDAYALSRSGAGTHMLFASVGMIIGGLFWSLLSDRVLRARRPVLVAGTLGLLLVWLVLTLFSSYPGFFWASFLYFAFGFFGISFLVNFACVKESSPPEISATTMGIVNTSMFLGVAFFQLITGYLFEFFLEKDTYLLAYRAVFAFCLGCLGLALAAAFFMPETFPRGEES